MFLQNLSKRERAIAFASFIIVLSALAYSFIIEPIFQKWARLNNESEAKLNMLKKDSRLLSMYKSLESDYAKFSKYAKSTKKEEEEIAAVLTEIETASKDSSCFLVSIKPQGTKDFTSHKEILIDVTAEADINQLSKFLYELENSPNILLKVKRFQISSKSSQPKVLRGTFLISKILMD